MVAEFNTDIPQTVFYPSLVINLQLRFDEGLKIVTPKEVAKLAKGEQQPDTAKSPQPVILARGSDNLSKVTGIVPRSCSVELNGYRQAATFNLEMEYRDLPLDPRVLRAVGIAIHLGAVSDTDWANGMEGSNLNGGRLSSIIQTTDDNLLLAGTVDSAVLELTDSGAVIRMDGRDLRGPMLDTNAAPEVLANLDVTQTIDLIIKDLLNKKMPQGVGIQIDIDASEWEGGVIPSPRVDSVCVRHLKDAAGKKVRAGIKGNSNSVKFWDIITNLCFEVGAVPHFVGSRLRIRPARTLFDHKRDDEVFKLGQGPFALGQRRVSSPFVSTPETFGYRRIVFGRDIDNLKIERKLAGFKVPAIRVVSTDPSQKGVDKIIEAIHPPTSDPAARATTLAPSGEGSQTDFITVNVSGIKDKNRLTMIARDLYEEVGRQEMGGSISTKNLTSFGGSNQDPDLLHLLPGDPIELRFATASLQSEPSNLNELNLEAGRSFDEQVAEVKKRVGDENLARAFVASNRGDVAQLQRTFRVANVKYDWNADSGVAIAFDFQNYVRARYDVTPSEKK